MVINARSPKRVKKRAVNTTTSDHNHDFFSFPSFPISDDGPFRSNIRSFLTRHALLLPPSSLLPHLVTWQVLFDLIDGHDFSLDVVEEEVVRSRRSVYCDHCRVVGWSEHPVCRIRYHLIVKANGESLSGPLKACPKCGSQLNLTHNRCETCNYVITSDDVEDFVYQQLENPTHLLHGVIHVNGYGHLLRVNGREGGSTVLSGSHIMDFWDRICRYLGVRKISVMDVSKKYGLEYRLLHAITNGHPWYGDWGYEFGTGSYALTHHAYCEAVETLSNVPLSVLISRGRKPRTHIQDLILHYLSLSENKLVNIRDLFDFLMNLAHDSHKTLQTTTGTFKKARICDQGIMCAWTNSDINRVEDAMVRVLRAVSGSSWVSWRTLRGAVCKAGHPGLLDYCLKELSGKQSRDGMAVHARYNPDTGALEYRIETGSNNSLQFNVASADPLFSNYPSREHVVGDLRLLYGALLHPQTMSSFVPVAIRDTLLSAATSLLDCKHFVKDYKPETTLSLSSPLVIHLFCQAELLDLSEERTSTRLPPELVALSPNATVADLKVEACKVFEEVYVMLKGFQAEEVVGVEDSTQVNLWFEPLEMVRILGKCPEKNGLGQFRWERGVERWTVDCKCGACDDDGERMLACDMCGVWQHTRCIGIPDTEAVPAKFVCTRCRSIGRAKIGCKDELMVVGGCGGGGKSLAMLFDVR